MSLQYELNELTICGRRKVGSIAIKEVEFLTEGLHITQFSHTDQNTTLPSDEYETGDAKRGGPRARAKIVKNQTIH